MTSRTAVLVGAVVLGGIIVGMFILTGDGEDVPTSTTVAVAEQVTTVASEPTVSGQTDTNTQETTIPTVSNGCQPIPGTEVVATGEVQGYPSDGEVDGEMVVVSVAQVWFSLDGPDNRNLVHLALFLVGAELTTWSTVGEYDLMNLSYEPSTSRLTGTIAMLLNVEPEDYATGDFDTAEVDLLYEAEAARLVGTVTHPDKTFDLDLATEDHEREYFDDPSCYPEPEDNPVDQSGTVSP